MTHVQLNTTNPEISHFNGNLFPCDRLFDGFAHVDISGKNWVLPKDDFKTVTLFTCDQCKTTHTHVSDFTTGYGTDNDGRKICFMCCGVNDRAALLALPIGGRYTLYLTSEPSERYPCRQFYVTNWPSTLKLAVHEPRTGRHNFAGQRYDVWFKLGGCFFHGVQYGTNTQICHIQRIKE